MVYINQQVTCEQDFGEWIDFYVTKKMMMRMKKMRENKFT